MAVVFDTYFDDNFDAWTFHSPNLAAIRIGNGCSGGDTFWTGSSYGHVAQQFMYDSGYYTTFTVRFQIAFTDDGTTPDQWPFWINGVNRLYTINQYGGTGVDPTSIGRPYSVAPVSPQIDVLWIRPDLILHRDGSLAHDDWVAGETQSNPLPHPHSAAGAIPNDGKFHGVQAVYRVTSDASYTVEIYVDNVQVLTGNHVLNVLSFYNDPAVNAYGYVVWNYGPGYYFVPSVGIWEVSFWGLWNAECTKINCGVAYGHVQFDDEALVADYPACSGIGIPVWKQAVVTGFTLDAPRQLTITGTDFATAAGIQVWGPDGTLNVNTVASVTPTAIVLTNLNPPFAAGDAACTTVTNPCL